MFTGLIQGCGRVRSLQMIGGDLRLGVAAGSLPFDAVALGESIAVNGCCLTVVAFDAEGFEADVSSESLACTTLGEFKVGRKLNLERAMLPTTRFGGHIMSGHADGVGRVASILPDARAQRWPAPRPRRRQRQRQLAALRVRPAARGKRPEARAGLRVPEDPLSPTPHVSAGSSPPPSPQS